MAVSVVLEEWRSFALIVLARAEGGTDILPAVVVVVVVWICK